jgi:membrane-bound ClpP family serine protease
MQMKRSNPTAWWAFWIGLLGLILMPIPLFIGFFLGGGLGALAGILTIIALLKSRHAGGRGIAPAVFAGIFVVLTFVGISNGGGIIW